MDGFKFYGKKPGTFRVIKAVGCKGTNIVYTDHNNKYGMCLSVTFIKWVDKTRDVE